MGPSSLGGFRPFKIRAYYTILYYAMLCFIIPYYTILTSTIT